MKKVIHHLRRQPEEARRHILHVLTILAAIILFIIWVYSLGSNLSNPDTKVKINNDLKPFSELKNDMVGGYQIISSPDESLAE